MGEQECDDGKKEGGRSWFSGQRFNYDVRERERENEASGGGGKRRRVRETQKAGQRAAAAAAATITTTTTKQGGGEAGKWKDTKIRTVLTSKTNDNYSR